MPSSPNWLVWALLSACFAAITAVLAKVGVKGVDSDLAMAIRAAIVAIIAVPFVMVAGKWSNPLDLQPRTLVFLALSAFAAGASWVCYFRALQIGEAFKVAPIDKFSVVLVAVFAFMFLGERPSGRDWAGIGLITTGLVLLALRR
ncbi:EamA family transporter [Luteimonas marina]|uniref:EamA family transporter n=2 Tax=Luteimonas marina TaxID=488485 RepID=A0A5C5TX69_9GAMM|nr:EamA family transporter [Luteimonas marina]TWT18227.1 EamA family transporter [Luteimonas marina]